MSAFIVISLHDLLQVKDGSESVGLSQSFVKFNFVYQ